MAEYQVTEYTGENCIVRIHKPILTASEKKAREKDVRTALAKFGRELERSKK